MLELDFYSSHEGELTLVDDQAALVVRAREIARSSNRLAVEFLLKRIGTRVPATKDEAYFGEALNYLCGIVYGHAGMASEAADAIAASNVLPHSGGDMLFHDAVAAGVEAASKQDEAIARGVPPILIASMPRSASAALTQTLAMITGAPLFRISVGAFPNYCIVPTWLGRFLRGGAVLHDHFGASEFNMSLLVKHQVRVVNLLVRDPRAAAVSFAKHVFGKSDVHVERMYSMYLLWLNDWLRAEKANGINIRWIRSSDVISGRDGLMTAVSTVLGNQSQYAFPDQLADANFSGQESDAWRDIVPSDVQEEMWDLMPPEIIERLELRR